MEHYVSPHYTPPSLPAPEPRWSLAWVAVLVVCALLGVALIVVVVLGATGVIFNVDCAAAKLPTGTAAAVGANEPLAPLSARTAALQNFPENSIEHAILKVPIYDPVTVSRAEEHNLTREQPVLRQVARESKFEPVTPPARPKPQLSVVLPTADEIRRAPHPPNPPRMLPFHPEPCPPAEEQIQVQRHPASSATIDRQRSQS